MVVYECNVCKRSVFSGRRKHVYERSHRERLAGLLKGFSSKVAGARKMIKVASVVKYDPLEHEQRFWCYCCEEEVKRHTSDGTLTVLYGGMLEHMKSPQHKKAVNKFWWIHQAERNLKEQFLLTSEEYERATTCIEAVPTDCDEAGPSGINNKALGIPPTGSGPCLTFVGHQEMPVKGNVHTGALPPWMIPDEEDGTEAVQEIGPSFEEFLKQNINTEVRKAKLQKRRGVMRTNWQNNLFQINCLQHIPFCNISVWLQTMKYNLHTSWTLCMYVCMCMYFVC
eukprot:XP_012822470.1 PREDICTED: coiled-coil domain-containing protein 84 isoform X6 [Xenopus tropicalis]